jgi:hypothetical protein
VVLKHYRFLCILLIILHLDGCSPFGIAGITENELKAHAEYLASDELMGRMIGEPGIESAEEYIALQFKNYGLLPLPGKKDFFMDFHLYQYSYDEEKTSIIISVNGQKTAGQLAVDFKPFPFSATGIQKADIVFAGYGITAPEYNYDDYKGLDVGGKIVLILRHEPNNQDPDSIFNGTEYTRHAYFITKWKNALDHGAVGMILFTDPLFFSGYEDLRSVASYSLEEPAQEDDKKNSSNNFLAVHISQELAGIMLSSYNISLTELQTAIDNGGSPASYIFKNLTAEIRIEMLEGPQIINVRNVAGCIPGSDPYLTKEWIIIGAHHDHIGSYPGDGDTIYNGADDNASGVSGVLELAQAFAFNLIKTKRSLLFITFSAEEEGLFGSEYFVEEEILPLESIYFMLNLDMIGRNPDKPITLFSNTLSTISPALDKVNDLFNLSLYYSHTMDEAYSDNFHFFKEGIATLFIFTDIHDDYHQVSDHADKLDFNRMQEITRFCYLFLMEIGSRQETAEEIHD